MLPESLPEALGYLYTIRDMAITYKYDSLEKCLEKFKRHKEVNFCKELICINKNGDQNASIRIMTYKTVFQKSLSTYLGSFTQDLTDIHTKEDLNSVDISKL